MEQNLGLTEKELIQNRVTKLKKLEEFGINPYPAKSRRNYRANDVISKQRQLIDSNEKITIAGRIMAKRGHGKMIFLDLEDESGKLQVVAKSDVLKDDNQEVLSLLEVGDFAEFTGTVFVTQRGELSLQAEEVTVLTKSIRPLPEKWHGLKDPETRFRERYVDLIVNPSVKSKFYVRSKAIQTIRGYLLDRGFLEVDTPVLQQIAGGASAKPFVTHYNAYDTEVFLRIAPELYLKRLLVGGFEKVFEIARCFRNEGADATHNPEFTMVEFYWAYSDYEKLMDFVEELIRQIIVDINDGDPVIELSGKKVDFSKKFKRLTFHELSGNKETDEAFKIAQAGIVEPTFVTNHPADMLPLAKKNEKNPKVVDSFQLIINSVETCKAFSELNDPIDQRQRFMDQMKLREKGDEEAQVIDEDFLKAIEHGMPPAAGCGIGIDRLVKVLTDSKTLREILFFPFMRPQENPKAKK